MASIPKTGLKLCLVVTDIAATLGPDVMRRLQAATHNVRVSEPGELRTNHLPKRHALRDWRHP